MLKLNRGAMFGLDARIALAIFGALSVISGAALYSAIQESKVVAIYTELLEVEKAIEAMYLDLGEIPKLGSNYYDQDFRTLYQDYGSYPSWNGPYFNFTSGLSRLSRSSGTYVDLEVSILTHALSVNFCTGRSISSSGGYFLSLTKYKDSTADNNSFIDLTLVKSIHDKFDNDGDYDAGTLRVSEYPVASGKGCLIKKIHKYT